MTEPIVALQEYLRNVGMERAFEAELQPAINPKIFGPEPPG